MIKSGFATNVVSKYKHYRNVLTSVLRNARKMHYSNLFLENKGNSKKTWSIINDVLNRSNGSAKGGLPDKLVTSCDDTDGHTSPQEIAQAFNDFFVHIGPNLADKMASCNSNFKDYLSEPNSTSFFMYPTSEQEVKNMLLTLNTKKSCGYDNLPSQLLRALQMSYLNL